MSTLSAAPGRKHETISSPMEKEDSSAMQLVAAVQALSHAKTIEAIREIVRKAARQLARADGATFVLKDGVKCYYVDEDAISPLWKGQRFPMSICISGWVMTNRRSTVIKDVFADDRVPADVYRTTFVKSMAMVPIRTDDPIGAIGVYWAKRYQASNVEVDMLEALANIAAVALENVQLYADLERRVEDRTRQLEDTNRELESFSYSVSHDLQAPLRHMTSYVSLLLTEHYESLNEEARGYLVRIEQASTHMARLIQDMLRLARFVRVELRMIYVDLSGIARELVTALRETEPERAVEVTIHDGLEVQGDEALLRVFLENMLANAWKFTGNRAKATIELGASKQADGSIVFFIKDNGAGFDMRYANKLFAPFQRLHGQKDFTGTGVGLATAKRILHRHGGTIWADAKPDGGATFFFTISDPSGIPISRT
jgi:K+-sensing histidine kinase KdpD